jgi:ribonuclease R
VSADRPVDAAARVAVLERRGKFLVAEPFFAPGPRMVVSRDKRFNLGDLVIVAPPAGSGRRGGRGGGRAVIARRLGRPDVARHVIEAFMIDRGLRRGFDPAVERDAREAAATGDAGANAEAATAGRRDLRSLPTFTIDPASARDFDDAISAERIGAGDDAWRVWVHIADVSFFVRSRSLVDREAYRRGTSVYVPGAVEPMLPRELSNNVCSLVPDQDRLAVTVEMTVRGRAVERASFYRSVIRSDARLEYAQVDRIFAGTAPASAPWGEPLAAARAASAALGARRAERAAIVLEAPEPDFRFDRKGNILGAEPVHQTESHRLIEHLMIAANEQVAKLLEERHVPALYRVHERPDGAAVERLVDQLASLEVQTPPVPRGPMTPQQAADVVGEISQTVSEWVASRGGRGGRALTSLVLRTLKQAYYDHRNLGHAGLQSPRYCHFTSPIRRYPDLICHRALLSAVTGDVPAPDSAWVAEAGPWTSAREREAMLIERDADDIARCFLLERELFERDGAGLHPDGPVFEGEVVGLIRSGAFVAFGSDGAYQGMVPVRRMHGDWWELNEQGTILEGTRRGGAIRLGDSVRVRVGGIDAPRGRVDLLPAWDED